MPLSLKITDAGRLAALNANANGLSVAIAEVGIGTARYMASVAATALQAEVVRVPVLSSVLVSGTQRTLRFRVGGGTAIDPVGEIGLYLNNTQKTLFAVWSEPVGSGFIVGTKGTNTDLLINANVLLGDLPTDSVTVVQQEPVNGLTPQVGGYGGEGNYELSGAATLSGRRRYQNFILRSTAVLTVDRQLDVECSGFALIEPGAVVNVSAATLGGASVQIASPATLYLFGNTLGLGYSSSGGYNTGGIAYQPSFFPMGSGGNGGSLTKYNSTTATAFTGTGGAGGGRITITAARGITHGGTINCNGTAATNATVSTGLISAVASGGGSGGYAGFFSPLFITFGATAITSVRGGAGGNSLQTETAAGSASGRIGAGGGGGGGVIDVVAPTLNVHANATFNIAGGAVGLESGPAGIIVIAGSAGGAFGNNTTPGAAGSVGRLNLLAVIP